MSVSSNSNDDESLEMFLQSNSTTNFMRFKSGSVRGTGELQTAIVSYQKRSPESAPSPSFQVDLVSAIHTVDKEYYSALQKELESYDCVLYESVALNKRGNPTTTTRLQFKWKCFIWRQIARILILDRQRSRPNCAAENWYHAGIDYQTFKRLEREKGESFSTRAGGTIKAMLPAYSMLQIALAGVYVIGSLLRSVGSPAAYFLEAVGALSRHDCSAAMKVFFAKGHISQHGQLRADVEDKSVIIGERNRVAMQALKRAMDENGHNINKKKIAIIYGAAHMPDMGRRLREEFDLVPSKVQWFTAWSIGKTSG